MAFMKHDDLQLHHRSRGNVFLPGSGGEWKEMPGFGIFLSAPEMNYEKLGDHLGEFSRKTITCKRAVVFFKRERARGSAQI